MCIKRLFLILVVLFLALDLSAEGGRERVTITFAISADVDQSPYPKVFQNYESKTGNKVEIQTLAGGNDYETIIRTRFATKDYPDIFYYFGGGQHYINLNASETLFDFINEPWVKDLTPAARDFQISEAKLVKPNGKNMYGVPWGNVTTLGLLYNKEIFAQLGISAPKNYADFLSICETIKNAGITPIVEAGKEAWPCQIFQLIGWSSFIDPVLGEEGLNKLNTNQLHLSDIPQIRDLFGRYVALKTRGYLNKNFLATTYDMQQEALGTGTAAMAFQGEWIFNEIKKKFGVEVVNKFGEIPLPSDNDQGNATIYAPEQLLISKLSKNAKTAVELVRFMTQQDQLQVFADSLPGVSVFTSVKPKQIPAQAQINLFITAGKAYLNIQNRLRPQMVDFDKITQELLITGDVDKAVRTFDENVRKDGANKKLPGF